MSDPDQRAEAFDDEVLGDEFPPDRPLGIDLDDDEVDPEDTAVTEDRGELVLPDPENPGPLAEDDEFTGDETTRDVATELVPPPAEEAALHIEDDDELDS